MDAKLETAFEEFNIESPLQHTTQIVPPDHTATGQVTRLYPDPRGCYIRVINSSGPRSHKDYYFLPKSHGNFNALYSLALAAATNRYILNIRTVDTITPSEVAEVQYLVQNF